MDHITETSSSSNIIHLFGSEGTGKSAIAQTVAEYCKTNGILGASFFFSRVSSERNTDKNLIATLAYQLCVAIPELKLFIAKAVEDDLSTFQKDVDTQMEWLIINPIIQATNKGKTLGYPILIVIDGLDECEGEKEQCAFLRAITGAIGWNSLPLYFFITSRQEGHIVNCLNEDRTLRSILDLDQNHIQTKRDIEAYICSEFERIRIVHHILDWPSQTSFQMVVSKTDMLFSRASEIMAFIDQKNAPSPETQLEVFLRTSGPGVKPSRPAEVRTVISGRVEVDGLRYRRRLGPNMECNRSISYRNDNQYYFVHSGRNHCC
jgi:NACHT domain